MYQITKNVPNSVNGYPAPAGNVVSTVTLTIPTSPGNGATIAFSVKSGETNQPVLFTTGGAYTTLAGATVSWTSNIAGDPIARNDTGGLYTNESIGQQLIGVYRNTTA